jgi:predicted transcriptional regulator
MERPVSAKEQFNLRIDSQLVMRTKILAARLKQRPNAVVEEAIRDLLKKYKGKA